VTLAQGRFQFRFYFQGGFQKRVDSRRSWCRQADFALRWQTFWCHSEWLALPRTVDPLEG
jgi:hypothetical protein